MTKRHELRRSALMQRRRRSGPPGSSQHRRPMYRARGYFSTSCGHCTRKWSTKGTRIFPLRDSDSTRQMDSTYTIVTYCTPNSMSNQAAAHMGMQVPGPLQTMSLGRARKTSETAYIIAYRVVHTELRYDWPTSRLRGSRKSWYPPPSSPGALLASNELMRFSLVWSELASTYMRGEKCTPLTLWSSASISAVWPPEPSTASVGTGGAPEG
mmetsp:Transcript_32229/g.69285  ORF Transcript_32229/g.69285 Transcript_32229/m.69285 type:complete len:211 (+) Transcript_32229:84-716(+)